MPETHNPYRVSLHWSASRWIERAYHDYIMRDGKTHHLTPYKVRLPRHTYGRNTGTVAVGLQGNVGATFENFGPLAITKVQIEAMCADAAVIVDTFGIPINSKHVFTHAEAALEDGYGPYQGVPDLRWDLMMLEPKRGIYTVRQARELATETGNILRRKIAWYLAKRKA